MSPAQRLAAAVVAVLLVVGIAVVAVVVTGGPIGVGDVPSAGPSASAATSEAPSGSDEPEPSTAPLDEEELLAILDEIEAEVEAIRGLPPAEIGPPELLTRAQLRDELEAILEEDYPPDERDRDNRFLRAMGLLAADQDFAELQLQLLGDGTLGFYDDQERRMVVVTDTGLDVGAMVTYAHEYTHALQDAAFDLDALDRDTEGEDDMAIARTTLVEGDATIVMLVWAFNNLSPQELEEYASGLEVPDTAGIPQWMVDQVSFTYETGLTWVGALAGSPIAPQFGPVDEAYADPPDSTEQVMDETLEAWREREEPIEVEAPDIVGVLGEGWSEVEETTMGQAMIQIMLEYWGAPLAEAEAAAAGWGGDRVVVANGPDDAFVAAWRLAWDASTDAGEFVAAYEAAAADLGFPVSVVEADGEVVVFHASSQDLLDRAEGALD